MRDVAFEPIACEIRIFQVTLQGAVDLDFELKFHDRIDEIVAMRKKSKARQTKVDLRDVTHFGAPGIRFLDRLAHKRAVIVLVKDNSFGNHIVDVLRKASVNKNRLLIDKEISS